MQETAKNKNGFNMVHRRRLGIPEAVHRVDGLKSNVTIYFLTASQVVGLDCQSSCSFG